MHSVRRGFTWVENGIDPSGSAVTAFVGILNGYWSSTTFAAGSTCVWSIDFGAGEVDTCPGLTRDVRAVRAP
jgi:hypothetical protein